MAYETDTDTPPRPFTSPGRTLTTTTLSGNSIGNHLAANSNNGTTAATNNFEQIAGQSPVTATQPRHSRSQSQLSPPSFTAHPNSPYASYLYAALNRGQGTVPSVTNSARTSYTRVDSISMSMGNDDGEDTSVRGDGISVRDREVEDGPRIGGETGAEGVQEISHHRDANANPTATATSPTLPHDSTATTAPSPSNPTASTNLSQPAQSPASHPPTTMISSTPASILPTYTTTTPPSTTIPQSPIISICFLLISGKRRVMTFEPHTTVGRVKELVWNAWPMGEDWQNERPPTPSYLRILHRGKILQDEDTLISLDFPVYTPPAPAPAPLSDPSQPPPSSDPSQPTDTTSTPAPASAPAPAPTSQPPPAPTIVHLAIRPSGVPLPSTDDLKKKRKSVINVSGIGGRGGMGFVGRFSSVRGAQEVDAGTGVGVTGTQTQGAQGGTGTGSSAGGEEVEVGGRGGGCCCVIC